MEICIDVRETALFALCSEQCKPGIKVTSAMLPLGDIVIRNGENDLVLIERKTVADLSSSIRDGRYREQSYRLDGCQTPNHNIVYLIEGSINPAPKLMMINRGQDSEPARLYSAMVSLFYKKGFSVWRSDSVQETATIVCSMADKIGRDQTKGENKEKTRYDEVVKRVKKDNITKENIGTIMLSCIPGISSGIASSLLGDKSVAEFIDLLKTDPHLLDNARHNGRKISDPVKKSVYSLLLSSPSSFSSSSVMTDTTVTEVIKKKRQPKSKVVPKIES